MILSSKLFFKLDLTFRIRKAIKKVTNIAISGPVVVFPKGDLEQDLKKRAIFLSFICNLSSTNALLYDRIDSS